MKKILLSAFALIASCYIGNAQTGNFGANYTYQINSGTYTALTTPTVISSGAAMDDAVFTFTLSTPFTLFGNPYSTLYVSENGYLTFGATAAPTTYNPLSAGTASAMIAPFGRDLAGKDASSQLSYVQTANDITFEWNNLQRYTTSTTGLDVLNFQVNLNYITRVISITYGTMTPGTAVTTMPQVGIRSAATTWAANVNNTTIASTVGNCSWANATAGSANTSTMYFGANTAVAPASGLQYIWTPATLTPPVRTIAAVSSIGSNSVVLNYTQPAGSPTGYNVQYRIANTCAWTNAVGNPFTAAGTLTLTGLAASTAYEYRIQAIFAAGNSIYSHVPATFTTTAASCSGTPNAGTVTASNTVICAPQNINLNLVGSTVALGLTYQWLSSPDGLTWNPIPTATTIATTQSVTSTTYYQCAVACGTNVATSSTITVTVGATPNAGATAATSTLVCPNQPINLSLTGASSIPGLTYQWQSSANGVTYSPIVPTASLATTSQTITSNIYFQNILTCGSATAASTPIQVMAAGTTTNTVPYFEGFEGITQNNQLPNCSWMATSPGTICLTYTATPPPTVYNRIPKSGTKFGSFRWSTAAAGDYFYTNGIQLTGGTNYIASADYIADGAAGWSEFSLLVGSTQSTVGLTNIASITGAITNTIYANASGTFSVPTTGIYYIAVKAIGDGNPWYLTFDDLKVDVAPTCTLAPLAGVISGPNNVNTGSVNAYTISPATGNIQWYSGSSATGPWSPIATATAATNQTITAVGSGTVYYTAVASTPGCINDTANASYAVNVIFQGNDVCSAIPLTIGTSPLFSLFGATTQTGEVVPPGTGNLTNSGWLNSNLTNSMWFTFVAPASGNVSIQAPTNMNAGANDPQLAVWSTTNCANLIGQATPTAPIGATLVAANDDDANYTTNAGAQYSSFVRAACLTPGATYYIQLDTYTAASPGDATTIIITDLGAYNASFSGLLSNYCLPSASSSLTPANAGGVFTVNGGTTTVTSFTPTTLGTNTVTYTNQLVACVTTSTTIVANTPSISASASSSSVCSGSSATLTASGTTNYTWTFGGNSSTEVVTPSSASVYTVTGETSGCSNTATVSVGVTATPTVMAMTSNTAICAGSSATLTASGATNYTWTSVGNTSTEVVTPTGNSTYTVTGEDLGCSSTAIVSVDVNQIPTVSAIASQTLLCDDGSTGASVLTASTTASTYSWSDGATTMTTAVTPTSTTTYTVTVTELGCSADAFVTVTVSNCNGVKELVANGINVYPNPTNGILNITISSELAGNTSIEVYDAIGKLAIKEPLSDNNTINLSKLEDGIYVFKVINNSKAIKIGKIVKQ